MPISTGLDRRTDTRIAAIIAGAWAVVTLIIYWNNWAPDLGAVYFAGYFYDLGQYAEVYASPKLFFGEDTPQSWEDAVVALGHSGDIVFPFVYPPIWAAIAAPFAGAMAPTTFFQMVYVVHVAMMVASIFLAYRIVRPGIGLSIWVAVSAGLLFASIISVSALFHNQPQISVTFFIILAMERYRSGAMVQAGLALAMAATIKISPALLILLFVADRQWRAVAAFTLLGGIILGLSFLVAGPELHWVFLDKIRLISGQIALMKVNFALEAYIYEIWALVTGHQLDTDPLIGQFSVPEPGWVAVVARSALVAGLAIAFLATRQLADDLRLPVRLTLVLLVTTLAAPLGWTHHYLGVLFLTPLFYRLYSRSTASMLMIGFALITNVGVFGLLSDHSTRVHLQMLLGVTSMLGMILLILAAPVLRNSIVGLSGKGAQTA